TFSPTSSQVKSYLFRYMVSIPQLSVDPTSTSCGRIETCPFILSSTVISLHCTTAGVISITYTVAVHWSIAPKLSVTVTTTFCSPTSAQVYSYLLNSTLVKEPSGSKLEFTQKYGKIASPYESRKRSAFLHDARGFLLSVYLNVIEPSRRSLEGVATGRFAEMAAGAT